MTKNPKFKTDHPAGDSVSVIWILVLWICFGFRVSDFGFPAQQVSDFEFRFSCFSS